MGSHSVHREMTPVNEGAASFIFLQFRNHKIGQFNFVYFHLQGLDTTITTESRLDLIYCILKEQYIRSASGKLVILFNDNYALVF